MSEHPNNYRLRVWIRERRQALKLTQKALGKTVGLSEHMISSIERGERRVGENLKVFLEALQANPEEIKQFATTSEQAVSLTEVTVNSSTEEEANTTEGTSKFYRDFVDEGRIGSKPIAGKANATSSSRISRRVVELAMAFFLGILVGATMSLLWWRFDPPAFQQFASTAPRILQPLAWQRCQNQPENTSFIWDAGGSDDSICIFRDQTIWITAGMDTILDEDGIRRRTAPLLIQRLNGNFSVRVKMDFDGGSYCCRHAGLGIRPLGDEQTWLRISKASLYYHILSQGIVNGKTKRAQIPGDSLPVVRERITYFELVRQGTSVAVSYSLDGKTWVPYFEYVDVPLPEEVEVFLVVHAASSTPRLTAQFSEFTVTPLP